MELREREQHELDIYGFDTEFREHNCLCSVLKVESLYSFSPTIGKQAFIVLTYRKRSKSSLLYIIQCLKLSSEDTYF